MKKLVSILFVAVALVGCGSSDSSVTETTTPAEAAKPTTPGGETPTQPKMGTAETAP